MGIFLLNILIDYLPLALLLFVDAIIMISVLLLNKKRKSVKWVAIVLKVCVSVMYCAIGFSVFKLIRDIIILLF